MKKTAIASLLLLCFLFSFSFSGVVASSTAQDITVSTTISHFSSLFSLSSAPVLLLPLVLVLVILALINYLAGKSNVGFMFTAASIVFYVVFLVFYSLETRNNSMYNTLNRLFEQLNIRVKKRDFFIDVSTTPVSWLTLLFGISAAAITIPSFSTHTTRYHLKRELEPYVFIAPYVILFVVFALVPIFYGIYTSFTKWDLYNEPIFAGLSNFKSILFDENNTYYGQLRNGLWNTVKFVIFVTPFCILVPLGLAMASRKIAKGSRFFQTIYYLPSLMSTTTVMLAWDYFFRKSYGFATNFLGSSWNWFSPPYSWVMLVIITVWWSNGGNMVIYQSSLASIPMEQYEAASIDGADAWQKFRFVTLPNMSYPMMYTLVTTVTAQFNVYGQPRLLMGYEYNGANAVLMMYIRDTAFMQGVAGIASSMALVLASVIMVAAFFQIRLMRGNTE